MRALLRAMCNQDCDTPLLDQKQFPFEIRSPAHSREAREYPDFAIFRSCAFVLYLIAASTFTRRGPHVIIS
jgi:hypothetical protein